ncbi:M20 family metallo-hydrolase [Spirochaeta cellobiosiphila]|uniref:M20 family metallo-hydrolase n=1 Tax=Spirochaeta cellobiosiphila TaxID=504483 RepID=UPI001FE088D1|nr:M20 family metallo-hydrolase [Spirochaeta cellobiosiphila]
MIPKGKVNVKEKIIELMKLLVSTPAYDPQAGGTGEFEKAEKLKQYLIGHGLLNIEEWPCTDKHVPSGIRPNFAVTLPGSPLEGPTLWILSHLDVVPPGDLSKWNQDPFSLYIEGDTLIGRGVEDNHHGLVASVMAALEIVTKGQKLKYRTKLLFVSDEEVSNEFGILHVLKQKGVFNSSDMALVPDGGNPEGNEICIAEKGILWLKISVKGKQCHGSMPDEGINALAEISQIIHNLKSGLELNFPNTNDLFNPSRSTFEPTKLEFPDVSINTIPGEMAVYFDCRILPEYTIEQVMSWIHSHLDHEGKTLKSRVEVSIFDSVAASSTASNALIVRELGSALSQMDIEPKLIGVGGGTVASYLRREGIDAAVWSTIADSAHQPNEYTSLKSIVKDSEIIVKLLTQE